MKHIFIAFKGFKQASKQEKWKILLKVFGGFVAAGVLAVAGVFIYFSKDLPSPGKVNTRFIAESTKIYDRTGEHLLYDVHGEEKRTLISFAEIPDTVKFATIALEDQNFYDHYGIKLTSIVRSALKDVLHRQASQGGSTITQQFVKNSILTREKTFSRKIKEVILSLELEQKFSKDEILGMYLNEIPYGSNAYGIEAAALTFFNKNARDLTLEEAALLAALPNAPTYYSPFGSHTEALKARQETAIKRMVATGYITQEQADEAINIDVLGKIAPYSENISAPHFVMYIKDYLSSHYGEQALEQSGMKVYTTLDWDKQQAAEQAVREGATNNTKYKAANASLVAMDPKTGQILAMVGSKDYFGKSEPAGCVSGKTCTFEPQDNVAIRNRQPGSSFKPFVYLSAFEKGYTPETTLWDVDTNFDTAEGKTYNPKNYDGKNHGPIQMKSALAMSLNVPAVKTLYLVGVKTAIATATKLGITTLTKPDNYGLSLVLGGGEVKLVEHVNAYATLATGGIYRPHTAILKITDSTGNILEQYKDEPGTRVLEEKYVAALDSVMSTNSLRASVFGENNPLKFADRPVAAKTGTTNEWRDGWTMGYTPSIAVGVWAGNNNNAVMAQGADGIYVAAPIWRKFMDAALKNSNIEQFPKYEKEETGKAVLDGQLDVDKAEIKVCKIPGKKDEFCLVSDACPEATIEKRSFFEAHDILYYVNKDDPRGDAPKNPKDDSQYKNWEEAVAKWIKGNKDFKKKIKDSDGDRPDRECTASDFANASISVGIAAPNDGATITTSSVTIQASASADLGVKKITLYIDDKSVMSSDSKSLSYNYSIPSDKKTAAIEIKAVAIDELDNADSASITIHTNIFP